MESNINKKLDISDINKSIKDIDKEFNTVVKELDEVVAMSKLESISKEIYDTLKYVDVDLYHKIYPNSILENDKPLIASYGETMICINENEDYEIIVDGNILCYVSSFNVSQAPYDKSPATYLSKYKLFILVGYLINDFKFLHQQLIEIMEDVLAYKKDRLKNIISIKNKIEDFKL